MASKQDDSVTSTEDLESSHTTNPDKHSSRSLSDILGSGIAVKLNGVPWDGVFLHIDEDGTEAIMILHGLSPAKVYDIELSIPDEEPLRKQIATHQENDNNHVLEPPIDSFPPASESSAESSPSGGSTRPITPDSSSPSSPIKRVTIEEQAAQLRQTQASLTQEAESLAAQLKLARREAQRSDAALRQEIEAVKRAAEKQAMQDQRAKQKVLALQESVKQTNAAALDMEAQAKSVEGELRGIRKQEAIVESKHNVIKAKADKKEQEVEEQIKLDKKRISEMQGELTSVSNRLEKVQSKKEKLETESIPELEHQLEEMRREIEQLENSTFNPSWDDSQFMGSPPLDETHKPDFNSAEFGVMPSYSRSTMPMRNTNHAQHLAMIHENGPKSLSLSSRLPHPSTVAPFQPRQPLPSRTMSGGILHADAPAFEPFMGNQTFVETPSHLRHSGGGSGSGSGGGIFGQASTNKTSPTQKPAPRRSISSHDAHYLLTKHNDS